MKNGRTIFVPSTEGIPTFFDKDRQLFYN